MRRLTELYGERPAHLAVLLGCLAVAGYVATFLLGDPALVPVLAWFVGAALGHDLLLVPLYLAVDRVLVRSTRRTAPGAIPVLNHLRVPALGAGLTLLMFLPGIIRQGEVTHVAQTGLDQAPYLGRWLGLVGVLALGSATIYLVRILRARSARSARGGPAAARRGR
jgi:hypothetical protein